MPRVMALDIATTTGFAVDRPGGGDKPLTGTFRAPHDGGDEYGRAFCGFVEWLEDMISVHKPTHLVFEAPVPRGDAHGFKAARLLLGLATLAEYVAARMGVDVAEAHIQSVRRHFVGNGRADKRDVFQRCVQLGWDVKSTDAADAAAIWDNARHEMRAQNLTAGPLYGRRA